MKKLLILLVAALAMVGTAKAHTATADSVGIKVDAPPVLLPNSFYGCILGYNTKAEVQKTLESRHLSAVDIDGSLVLQNVTQGGIQYSAAMMNFNENGVFDEITFLNSGMEKDQALEFSNSLYTILSSKYIMLDTKVGEFKCYFTSLGGYTCILTTGGSDGSYFVSLTYEDGEPNLKASDKK